MFYYIETHLKNLTKVLAKSLVVGVLIKDEK